MKKVLVSSCNRDVIAGASTELPRGMGMIRNYEKKFVETYPQYALSNLSEGKLDEPRTSCEKQ